MFGGAGLFFAGKMFALISEDTIYLKTNSKNRKDYEDIKMPPFTYNGKRKPIKMSYHQLPEDYLEDPEKLKKWAKKAINAAITHK